MDAKEFFYFIIRSYRDKLKDVHDQYDAELLRLERFKGSTGYEEDRRKISEKLEASIKSVKEEYSDFLYHRVEAFESMVANANMPAPTDGQVNILKALQFHANPSKDLLILAGRSLSSSPLAFEALRSLAKDKGVNWFPGLGNQFFTLSEAQNITHNLRSRVTDMLIYMKRPGDKVRYVNDPKVPTTLLSYDFDYADADQCFEAFAGIDHATAQQFFDFCTPDSRDARDSQ